MPKRVCITPRAASNLYIAECRARSLAPKTLRKYEASLDDFLATPLPTASNLLDSSHAILWLDRLRGRGLTAGAISTYQRAVWTWFSWLYMNDLCPVDIARRVKRVRVTNPKRRTATVNVHDRLIVCARDNRENRYRNVAIIELLWASGLRTHELADLVLDDVDFNRGEVLVRHGKGDKRRVAGIDAVARLRLTEYLELDRGYEPGPLFLSRNRGPLTGNAVRMFVQRLSREANVTCAPHDFRRANAARLLAADVAADNVARHLGHSNVNLTLVYGEEGRTDRAMRAYHSATAGRRAK